MQTFFSAQKSQKEASQVIWDSLPQPPNLAAAAEFYASAENQPKKKFG